MGLSLLDKITAAHHRAKRQLILEAKRASPPPWQPWPLAEHHRTLTGNDNDLTFAIRL
jgi:hypothetical protein